MNPSDIAKLLARKDELETLLGRFEFWLLLFGILVVVGVGGESYFGIRNWWNNRKLHEVERQIAQYRQDETAKTNERAASANERAAHAESTAKAFESRIAESNAIAKTAEAQVASANARAQEAVAMAEREKLARLQLEARLADRTLTPEQQNSLVTQLSSFRGTVIDVIVWGDTPEIQIISSSVLNALRSAGWTVTSGQAVGGGAAVRGILIGTRPDSDANMVRASATLISTLQAAGIAAGPWAFEKLLPPTAMMNSGFTGTAPLRMFIGAKP